MSDRELFKRVLDVLKKVWLLGDDAAFIVNPAIDAISARLAEPEQAPDGYRIVPVEPTEAMLQSALDRLQCEGLTTTTWMRRTLYRAMLDAAPQSTVKESLTTQEPDQAAETYLRNKYGAYKGHFAWRELEDAYNAGRAAAEQAPVRVKCDGNHGGPMCADPECWNGGEPMAWPKNAEEVRAFMGSHVATLRYGRADMQPSDDDSYTLSAHDFLTAVDWWIDCPVHYAQSREWVPLTDEDVNCVLQDCGAVVVGPREDFAVKVARAVEAALKERNHG